MVAGVYSRYETSHSEYPFESSNDDDNEREFVGYGERLCLLCEGQLLALTRKFNLTYRQMTFLLLSTLLTGGAMGIASFFIWKKGLFRKRYAALCSAAIYSHNESKNEEEEREDDAATTHKHTRMVTFRLFAYDPSTKSIDYHSIGKPVEFGKPVVLVHAATRRVMKFKLHKHCVTLSRPPKHAHFQQLIEQSNYDPKHSQLDDEDPEHEADYRDQRKLSRFHSAVTASTALSRSHSSLPMRNDWSQIISKRLQEDQEDEELQVDEPTIPDHRKPTPLYRSISESCIGLVQNLNHSFVQQRERQREKRRRNQWLKELPNISLDHAAGEYFLAVLEPVALRHDHEPPRWLRWGAPMTLVAAFNHRPCGIRSREYYKDSQLYLSTEAATTTLIPIRKHGDWQSIAKASTQSLMRLEHSKIHVSIGTYNVWMMPRKVSAFSSVSPKKNTRAHLMADVLPNCDVWVFTECFDHRARAILLDRLKAAGYFYSSPTVGHKQVDRPSMKKLLNGGVVLVSRYPIVDVKIRLFHEVCVGADAMADKGVLYCKILKDGLLLHVFATHLQAWNDVVSQTVRRKQLDIMAQFMKSCHIPQDEPVFFVGDLNVNYWLDKKNPEYPLMLEILNAIDPSVVAKQQHDQLDFKRTCMYSFDRRLNPLANDGLSSDGSLELLDYVLYSTCHKQPVTASSYIQPIQASTPWQWKKQPQYHLSDHFPVISSFTFAT